APGAAPRVRLGRGVPAGLAGVVRRMLAANPARRYQRFEDVAAALAGGAGPRPPGEAGGRYRDCFRATGDSFPAVLTARVRSDSVRSAYRGGIGRFFNPLRPSSACFWARSGSSLRDPSAPGASVTVTLFGPAHAPAADPQLSFARPLSSVTPVAIAAPP